MWEPLYNSKQEASLKPSQNSCRQHTNLVVCVDWVLKNISTEAKGGINKVKGITQEDNKHGE